MRALKTFLRKRKADMLWCGDCECRTLKCWREANCICDDVSPVPPVPPVPGAIESVSNFSADNVTVDGNDEETRTAVVTFDYTPVGWDTWIELQYDGGGYFTAEITSLSNWQWVITITALQEEGMAEPADVWVYLEATQQIAYTITVEVTWA